MHVTHLADTEMFSGSDISEESSSSQLNSMGLQTLGLMSTAVGFIGPGKLNQMHKIKANLSTHLKIEMSSTRHGRRPRAEAPPRRSCGPKSGRTSATMQAQIRGRTRAPEVETGTGRGAAAPSEDGAVGAVGAGAASGGPQLPFSFGASARMRLRENTAPSNKTDLKLVRAKG